MMTVLQAAKFLRDAAEMTSKMSQDWDNFEVICKDMIIAAVITGNIDK